MAKQRLKKPLLWGILIALVLSFLFCAFLLVVLNDRYAFIRPSGEITLTLTEAHTASDIASALKDGGMIRFPSLLARKIEMPIEAGVYVIPKNASIAKINAILQRKSGRAVVKVTFAEGETASQMIDRLCALGIGDRARYIEVINHYPFDYDWLPAGSSRPFRLEGYLFPDTYEFYQNAREEQVIAKMLANFDRKFDHAFRAQCEKRGMTIDQAVTMASVIQAEAKYLQEFPLVSSVLHNRQAVGRRWESDATVRYALSLQGQTRPVTPSDLYSESPYNTYQNAGYPPSAICNAGREALAYALTPKKTDYYYFVAEEGGRTLFARTYSEHLSNIALAKQKKST